MYMKEGRRRGGEREENSKQEQRNPHCRNHSTGLWVGWGGASRVKFNRFSYLVKCPRAAAFCCSWVKLVAQQGGALSSSPLQGMWGASSGRRSLRHGLCLFRACILSPSSVCPRHCAHFRPHRGGLSFCPYNQRLPGLLYHSSTEFPPSTHSHEGIPGGTHLSETLPHLHASPQSTHTPLLLSLPTYC
uniref:Uncharacterized protein n=1 Tax=Rousettus aegyptiacus TaxID=9407 RepID=A0A7J8GB74_ROUAE|nr:hypothetical protein HJG63_011723 [Rousettus aegyptiacus]